MENHIYILDTNLLESTGTFDLWYRKMPVKRRRKIDSFYFLKDKCLSLGAGILLHKGLLHEGIKDRELYYGENGKPFLRGRDNIHFNLSHSENMVICAFSDRPVGADIEAYRHFDDDLAEFVYHESEIGQIRKSGNDANIGFTQLWTIKESIMKYFGTGLSLEPKELYIDMCDSVSAFCNRYNCKDIYFTQKSVEGYYITICSGYKDFSDRLEWVVP